ARQKVRGDRVIFLMADAQPHIDKKSPSAQSKKEKEWLLREGYDEGDLDAFVFAHRWIEKAATGPDGAVVVPILYRDSASQCAWFHQLALISNGVCAQVRK